MPVMASQPVVAVVLAGGAGRRFAPGGCNKPLLEVDRVPLLVRVLTAAAPVVESFVVVAAPDERLPALDRLDARVDIVRDARPGAGPLPALLDGLAAVGPAPSAVLLVSADLPWLRTQVVRLLAHEAVAATAQDCYDWVVPRIDGYPQVLVSCLTARAIPAVAAAVAEGSRSLRHLLARVRVLWLEEDRLRPIDPHLESFRDIDLPRDLPPDGPQAPPVC